MTAPHCRRPAFVPALLLTATLLAPASASASEVTVHVRSRDQDPVIVLNRFTFAGNVVDGLGDLAQNWVVFFTSLSDPQGVRLVPSFRALAGDVARQLNAGRLFSSFAKFAVVDCSVEQDLCSEQNVDHLPSLVHYRDGVQVARWRSKSGVGMLPWLRSQLTGGPISAKMRREEPPATETAGEEQANVNNPPDAAAAAVAGAAAAPAPVPSDGGVGKGEDGSEDACRADDEVDEVAENELHQEGSGMRGFIPRFQQTSFSPALTLSLVLGVVGASFWIVLQGVLLEP